VSKSATVRQREGLWAGLCRGLAVCLRLCGILCRGLGAAAVAVSRGLDSSARVLLETVAEERI
jgi:hypothetical protein